jgi:hypothetical protein
MLQFGNKTAACDWKQSFLTPEKPRSFFPNVSMLYGIIASIRRVS